MRKLSMTIMIFFSLAVGLAVGVAGCGTAPQTGSRAVSQTAAQTVAQPSGAQTSSLSPENILAKAVSASQNLTSAEGSFEVTMSFDIDPAGLPQGQKALTGQPMNMSGTFVYSTEPQAGEFALQVSAAQQSMNLGLKLVGDKAWFQFMNQWYEAPPEMQKALGQPSGHSTTTTDLQQMMSDLGVDLTSWLKDLRLVGEESVNGTPAYHLTASPDIAKMLSDLVGLMQSGELMKAIDPSGSATDLMGPSSSLPSAATLQEIQKQLGAMLHDVTADIWIAKSGFAMLKSAAGARMTPPPDTDPAGINAIQLSATVSLHEVNHAVTVEPPASTQPWTALQQALQANPGLFMGSLFGSASSSSTAAPGVTSN